MIGEKDRISSLFRMKLLLIALICVCSMTMLVSGNYKMPKSYGYKKGGYGGFGIGGGGFSSGSDFGFCGIFELLIFIFVFIIIIRLLFGFNGGYSAGKIGYKSGGGGYHKGGGSDHYNH